MDKALLIATFFAFLLGWLFLVNAWAAALAAGFITGYQIISLVAGGLVLAFSGALFQEAVNR